MQWLEGKSIEAIKHSNRELWLGELKNEYFWLKELERFEHDLAITVGDDF